MKQKNQVSTELANFDQLPSSGYVRLPTVMQLCGMSSATVWRHSGKSLPSPKKLSPGVTGWNVGELRASLKDKNGA